MGIRKYEFVTEEQIMVVKDLLKEGLKPREIAQQMRMEPKRIYSIICRNKIGKKKYHKEK